MYWPQRTLTAIIPGHAKRGRRAISAAVARFTSVSQDCHEEVAGWLDPLPTTNFISSSLGFGYTLTDYPPPLQHTCKEDVSQVIGTIVTFRSVLRDVYHSFPQHLPFIMVVV